MVGKMIISTDYNEKQQALEEKIEILPVDLLEKNRPLVESLKSLANGLHLEFGWHYLLDLTWILRQLGPVNGKKIMDAGAGTGILQWYLAQEGAEVISVDRLDRTDLALRFRKRFNVQGLSSGDLSPAAQTFWKTFRLPVDGSFLRRWRVRLVRQTRDIAALVQTQQAPGQVLIYNQDLADLKDIPDNSLDAAVSVSALEHNTPEGLERVVQEIMRVLKPGAPLLATLTAGKDQDWWHAPSSGWCYTDVTLRRIFDLPADLPSNYMQYDQMMEDLRNCTELRDNLASFYNQAGDKGMPDGRWDPQYQPVGVCKVKDWGIAEG